MALFDNLNIFSDNNRMGIKLNSELSKILQEEFESKEDEFIIDESFCKLAQGKLRAHINSVRGLDRNLNRELKDEINNLNIVSVRRYFDISLTDDQYKRLFGIEKFNRISNYSTNLTTVSNYNPVSNPISKRKGNKNLLILRINDQEVRINLKSTSTIRKSVIDFMLTESEKVFSRFKVSFDEKSRSKICLDNCSIFERLRFFSYNQIGLSTITRFLKNQCSIDLENMAEASGGLWSFAIDAELEAFLECPSRFGGTIIQEIKKRFGDNPELSQIRSFITHLYNMERIIRHDFEAAGKIRNKYMRLMLDVSREFGYSIKMKQTDKNRICLVSIVLLFRIYLSLPLSIIKLSERGEMQMDILSIYSFLVLSYLTVSNYRDIKREYDLPEKEIDEIRKDFLMELRLSELEITHSVNKKVALSKKAIFQDPSREQQLMDIKSISSNQTVSARSLGAKE